MKTLLAESLGPEVTIAFGPGVMTLTVDERMLAPEKRDEWLRRLRGWRTWPARPRGSGNPMACMP